jgi:hypothetical protein
MTNLPERTSSLLSARGGGRQHKLCVRGGRARRRAVPEAGPAVRACGGRVVAPHAGKPPRGCDAWRGGVEWGGVGAALLGCLRSFAGRVLVSAPPWLQPFYLAEGLRGRLRASCCPQQAADTYIGNSMSLPRPPPPQTHTHTHTHMPQDRVRIEAEALAAEAAHCPQHVPALYHYDARMCIVAMQVGRRWGRAQGVRIESWSVGTPPDGPRLPAPTTPTCLAKVAACHPPAFGSSAARPLRPLCSVPGAPPHHRAAGADRGARVPPPGLPPGLLPGTHPVPHLAAGTAQRRVQVRGAASCLGAGGADVRAVKGRQARAPACMASVHWGRVWLMRLCALGS